MKELFEIFIASAKVGALTFGGGYAMLPILQREIVESKGWNTEAEILDYYALSQCLPGILMVNTLAFVGKNKKGTAGAVFAALGAAAPSFVIITVIASILKSFADYSAVKNAFAGIRVCVCVLIFNAVMKLWKSAIADFKCLLIFIGVLISSLFLDVTPIIFVVAAALLGIAITMLSACGASGASGTKPATSKPANSKPAKPSLTKSCQASEDKEPAAGTEKGGAAK